MEKIRAFLIDDHYVVCEGLRTMLEQEEELCVVGEAHSGEEALTKLNETPSDVVLLDVRMAGMDGIETLRAIKASQPDLKVIMLTSYGDEYLTPSIEAGANGYLLKRANRAEMVRAIREAVQGGAPLDSLVTPGTARPPPQHSSELRPPAFGQRDPGPRAGRRGTEQQEDRP